MLKKALEAVRSGGIDLTMAFKSGLKGKAFLVTVDWDAQTSRYEEVNAAALGDSLLPEAGERINLVLEIPTAG